jgi:hypothetical protein
MKLFEYLGLRIQKICRVIVCFCVVVHFRIDKEMSSLELRRFFSSVISFVLHSKWSENPRGSRKFSVY